MLYLGYISDLDHAFGAFSSLQGSLQTIQDLTWALMEKSDRASHDLFAHSGNLCPKSLGLLICRTLYSRGGIFVIFLGQMHNAALEGSHEWSIVRFFGEKTRQVDGAEAEGLEVGVDHLKEIEHAVKLMNLDVSSGSLEEPQARLHALAKLYESGRSQVGHHGVSEHRHHPCAVSLCSLVRYLEVELEALCSSAQKTEDKSPSKTGSASLLRLVHWLKA